MKAFFLAIATAIGSLCAYAAEPVTIHLWAATPAPCSNEIPADKEDASNPGWIKNVSDPTVTIYPAEKPNGTAMLMCPGGGYAGLAALHEGSDLAKCLNENGITLAVLKYRMPNNGHYTVPADDARRALQILREKAHEYSIDPARIGIGGASAGGHLASTVATHSAEDMPLPAFQVLFYPVISMKEGVTHQGSHDNLLGKNAGNDLVALYNNDEHVTPETPPALILVSADDDVVPLKNSMDYFDALIKNGVKASIHVYPIGGHGWACRDNFPYNRISLDELVTWLNNLYK